MVLYCVDTDVFSQVGDGLEIFIVLASGRPTTELEHIPNIKRVYGATTATVGEKIFVLRKDLKKD